MRFGRYDMLLYGVGNRCRISGCGKSCACVRMGACNGVFVVMIVLL